MEYNTLSPYKVHLAHSSNSTVEPRLSEPRLSELSIIRTGTD